jgi:hypothetical protein
MPDYNLNGLSTRSFEQLVQALGAKTLGPGTVIFGDGPDGAREATFEGTVNYPSSADQWNGYIVIQAKFKQRLEGTTKDGEWARKQLQDELEKFMSKTRQLRVPEFYLFCTNVVLTPKYRSGSKDRLESVFSAYRNRLALKGHDVWDYDKIRVFLDSFSDIRRAYAAWITPGDVLSSILSQNEKPKADFQKNISAFLQKELLADQYVNLDQAGHSGEEQIPMARVFVDLVATSQPLSEPPQEESGEHSQQARGFVREVILAGSRRLSDEPATLQRESNSLTTSISKPDLGRFVLVGGPGQGKSTTAQYLCQVYRVALLGDVQKGTSPECRNAMTLIQKHCKNEALPDPGARRFPFRIVLSDFAKELASEKPEAPRSLLAYIAHRIRLRTTSELSTDDIKEWLAIYPWFLVLDGLDEVPASSNRDQVLASIADFWVDVATNKGDLLVLATTRPQGYSKDFSADFYTHRYLAPLSVKHALQYATRLTEARFGHDVERGKRVMERLGKASAVEATARLMTSPLQVTIMATLVDRAGQPPPERWRLFSEYYDVIYKREMERDNPAARILRNHKTNIDAIHQLAGLELQTEGERTGRTDARLSRNDLTKIVKSRLASEGYGGFELEQLSNNIADAATQRLVFLVGVGLETIGFEIRSLQEFMAAEALMEGTDSEIAARLKAIAPITYWRNVFLFAAGKCFTHRQHLRDTVVSVCENLNEESELDHLALTGSEIALDLVRDGTATQHPKFQNRLARLACRLAAIPCGSAHQLLADSYYDALDVVFREEIPRSFPPGPDHDHSGGVCAASWLTIRGVSWASQLADSHWPKESKQRAALLKRLITAGPHAWLQTKIIEFVREGLEPPRTPAGLQDLVPPNWGRILGLVSGRIEVAQTIAFQPEDANSRKFFFRITPCADPNTGQALVEAPSNNTGLWDTLRSCGKFLLNPTKRELAEWLHGLANVPDLGALHSIAWPWPLKACLNLVSSPESSTLVSARALAGEFGERDDWLAAEARWTRGINSNDFVAFDKNNATIGPYIRDEGFPVHTLGTTALADPGLMSVLHAFIGLLDQLKAPTVRAAVSSSLAFVAALLSRPPFPTSLPVELTPDAVLSLARETNNSSEFVNLDGLIALSHAGTSPEWLSTFDQIGRSAKPTIWGPSPARNAFASVLRDAFLKDVEQRGLARILGRFAMAVPDEMDADAIQIPLPILRTLEWTDSPFRLNLLFLRLSNTDTSDENARMLAREIAAMADTFDHLVANCLGIAKRRLSLAAKEHLVMELCRTLPQSSWEARSLAFEAIHDLLTQRHSTLGDAATRQKLMLPALAV